MNDANIQGQGAGDLTPRRVRISSATREVIEDVLSRWKTSSSEETVANAEKLTLRTTYVQGPAYLMDELGEQIEDEARDAGDAALADVFDDNVARQDFAWVSATTCRIMLGRRLRGLKVNRRVVWREVAKIAKV